jgi:nucleoside-diphosphate-sugar epimerase
MRSSKRVVVTGATGYIGQYCVSQLKTRGFDVHGFSSKAVEAQTDDVSWYKIDLLKESALRLIQEIRPTHLLHLAWYAEHGKYWTSPLNNDWVDASIRLVNEFRSSGGKRFVFSGSCAEYSWGGHCEEGVTGENPSTLYGQCKKKFSDYIKSLNGSSHFSTAAGRVFFLYGPKETPSRLIPSVVRQLLSGSSAKCTDGTQIRDFMYVDDVAEALVELLDSDVTGIVNIASGIGLPIKEILLKVGNLIGDHKGIDFGANPRSPDDPGVLTASVKRLRDEVGFFPKVPIEIGLARSIEFERLRYANGP